MNDTRLLRDIKDRLTIIAVAVSLAAAALLALTVMAAVWFLRVEEVRERAQAAQSAAQSIERPLPLRATARGR